MRHLDIDNTTLIWECRNGDREAMSILYTRFAPRMLHVISRYVQDSDSAQDILHDGFIAAFTRLDTIRDPERIDIWLATIMKNLSLKYLQSQSVSSLLEEIPDIPEDPELDGILDFATLESLIAKLPEGYQKVFRLAVLENKSHKEISEILGIAPNSSSSQLFHAKLRLRELIKEYKLRAGLISILLLLVCAGILIRFSKTARFSSDTLLSAEVISENVDSTPVVPSLSASGSVIAGHTTPVMAAQCQSKLQSICTVQNPYFATESNDTTVVSDSVDPDIQIEKQKPQPFILKNDSLDSFYDRLFADLPPKTPTRKVWTAGISIDSGLMCFNTSSSDAERNEFFNSPSENPSKPEPGTDDDDHAEPSRISRTPTTDIKDYLSHVTRHHHLPISFALMAERHFSSWIALESGIGYSYLHTDFECSSTETSTCHWHYLEIPAKVNFYAYTAPALKLYGSLGGRVAIPIYSYAQIAANPYCESGRFGSKPVWSVGVSVGAAFRLSKTVDLFIEPSLRYHFPQDAAIPNIWTDDQPFSLSIPLGMRLSW